MRYIRFVSLVVLVITLAAATGLVTTTRSPTWGEFHTAPADRLLRLSATVAYSQTVKPEASMIRGALFQLQPPIPTQGFLVLEAASGGQQRTSRLALADVPASGEAYISIPPLPAAATVTLTLSTEEVAEPLQLRYQNDATKYPDGFLSQVARPSGESKEKAGDLAFRLEYHSSLLEKMGISLAAWLAGLCLIILAWYFFVSFKPGPSPARPVVWYKGEAALLTGLVLVIGGFYLYHLGPACLSCMNTEGDSMKNMMYVNSALTSWQSGRIPHWHHTTCGGQPLLGNPETDVIGAGVILAQLFDVAASSKLLFAIEAALLAAGGYLLGRTVGLGPIAALLPGLVLPLHGFFVNRIVIGHTMFTGGLALAPWILLAFLRSFRQRGWVVAAGGLMALAFYRGDTHVLAYTQGLIGLWVLWLAIRHRRWQVLTTTFSIFLIFLVLSAPKLLPVLESQSHFQGNTLGRMVVVLSQHALLGDVFLDGSSDRGILDSQLDGGEWEYWENVGLYVGWVPLLLALAGLAAASPGVRPLLIIGLLVFLVVGEGTLYHYALDDIPYLRSLMRLPSRSLVMVVIAGSLTGGFALQWLSKHLGRAGQLVVVALLGVVLLDLGWYTHRMLARMEFTHPSQPLALAAVPRSYEPHPFKTGLHPLEVAQSGNVAPHSCQDLNVPPPFSSSPGDPLVTTEAGTPLAATLAPNTIQISSPHTKKIRALLVDSPLLSIENGYALPAEEEGLFIVAADPAQPITLSYASNSARPGLILAAGFLISLAFERYRRRAEGNEVVA